MFSHINGRKSASGFRCASICGVVLGALLLGMSAPSAEAAHSSKGHAAAKGHSHHGHAKKGKKQHHKKTKRQNAIAHAAKKHQLAHRKGHKPYHFAHRHHRPGAIGSFASSWWSPAYGPRVVAPVMEPSLVISPVPVVVGPAVITEKVFDITFIGMKGKTRTIEIRASSESEARRKFRADHPNADLKSIEQK